MSKYSDLLIMQYHKKPKAVATINAWCNELDKIIENCTDLLKQWDIDQARGYSLDLIGKRIGVSRTLPNYISKGYLGYYGASQAEPWGVGRWYRAGDTTGESMKLNDSDYRFVLKAKILKNFQNGTLDYVIEAFESLIGVASLVEDNYDMTVNIHIPIDQINQLQDYLIKNMDILPRPMGVMYNYINASNREFGFDQFSDTYGFNEGRFIDA